MPSHLSPEHLGGRDKRMATRDQQVYSTRPGGAQLSNDLTCGTLASRAAAQVQTTVRSKEAGLDPEAEPWGSTCNPMKDKKTLCFCIPTDDT